MFQSNPKLNPIAQKVGLTQYGQSQSGLTPPAFSHHLRSRAFEFDFFQNTNQFIADLQQPESPTRQAFSQLINWSGIQRAPLKALSQVVAMSGNSLIAAGLAMTLAQDNRPHKQKIALLEWGQPEPLLGRLFHFDNAAGLSELFSDRCDLEHLIVSAKTYRPLPELYVLGQGARQPAWLLTLPRMALLLKALSKKFHRIVLSLPCLDTQPELAQVFNQLNLEYALCYDTDHRLLADPSPLQSAQSPNRTIQRLY